VFFDELTAEGLKRGIDKFKELKWDEKVIRKNALRFSTENFKKGIREVISGL